MIKHHLVLLLVLFISVLASANLPTSNNRSKQLSHKPIHTCCMPREHTFHFQGTKTDLSNCKNGANCAFTGFGVFKQRHMPDFYHRRYRLDSHIEMNGMNLGENTVMGFMDPYPSNLGIEYSFNSTACSCKKLTQQGEMLMVTCVESDFTKEDSINVGIETENHVKAQRFIRKKQLNSNTTVIDVMVVQPIEEKAPPLPYPDPYPCQYNCAIIFMEQRVETRDSNGGLTGVSSFSGGSWNFKPFNTDSDYIIPSYCPKC